MRLPHYLVRNPSGRFVFRLRVPRALQALTKRLVIKHALCTTTPRLAQQQALGLAARYAQVFEQLGWQGMPKPPKPEDILAGVQAIARVEKTGMAWKKAGAIQTIDVMHGGFMKHLATAITCLLACACSPASVAEQPENTQQEKRELLAWVSTLSRSSDVNAHALGKALRIKLSQQGNAWQGQRRFGKGAITAKVEGEGARVGFPADASGNCIVTTGELMLHAQAQGYTARFAGVPGRPRFWNFEGARGVALSVYGRPNLTEDTKDTACVATIFADKEVSNG